MMTRVDMRRPTWAILAGILAAAIVVGARMGGILQGTWVNVLFFACLLLLPVAHSLSARICVMLTIVMGLMPLLWWTQFDFWGLGRSAAVLAATLGALTGCFIGFGPRSLVPRVSIVDLLPVGTFVLGVAVQWQLLTTRSFENALALMIPRWDHASHFDMFYMIRTHGVVISLLGNAPDGSAWSFTYYPQGFHALVVALTEMARTPAVGDAGSELVSYANYSSFIAIAVAVLATAAVCSLSGLRRRPALIFPLGAVVTAAWVFGPGAAASFNGFANFLVATVLAGVAVLTACTARARFSQRTLWMLSACLVGVANNWALIGVFVVGAALVYVLPWPSFVSSLPRTLPSIALACLPLLVAIAGVGAAASLLVHVTAGGILFGNGGVPVPDIGTVIIVMLACIAVFAFPESTMRFRRAPSAVRLRWAWVPLACGMSVVVVMATAEIIKAGTVTYYAYKLLISSLLIAVMVVALGVVRLGRLRRAGSPRFAEILSARAHAPTAVVASAATVAGLFVFGFPLPLTAIGLPATASAGTEIEAQFKHLAKPGDGARNLIQATTGRTGHPAMYLTTQPDQIDPVLAKQWYDALTGTYTVHGWTLSLSMFALDEGIPKLPGVVAAIRAQDPSARFIVDPANQGLLAEALR